MAPAQLEIDVSPSKAASSRQAWWPVTMMMACSLLSYIDRQTLAVLSPMILSDLKLNAQKYSQIISSFSFAYMLGNPVWGGLLDRIGLRRGMTFAVAIWTVACGAHAVLSGFLGFAIARAVLGFGEGATFPGGLRTAMDWLPPKQQVRGLALAYSGGSLGAIVTPLLVTPIALAYGWRAAFLVTGVAGLLWVFLWRQTVDFSGDLSGHQPGGIVLPNLLERRFWSLVASYGFGALPLGPILYLAPLYLSRALGFTQGELGRVLWIPPFGWEAGYFFWGWFADRYAAGNKRPTWLFFTFAILGLPLVSMTAFHSSAAVLALMFWAMFVSAGFVVVSLRTSALAYPKEQTGLVAGIGAGSWSAIVALVLPALGHMFDVQHYANAFLFVGTVPVFGAISWWGLTAPSDESDDRSSK
jgi:ACS family hexuronate transporter-like MFS transporter